MACLENLPGPWPYTLVGNAHGEERTFTCSTPQELCMMVVIGICVSPWHPVGLRNSAGETVLQEADLAAWFSSEASDPYIIALRDAKP